MDDVNILGWLTGGVIEQFTGPLERAYKARLEAQNSEQRLEAEKQIAFFQGQIELATVAASQDKWWSPRTLMAWGVTLYVLKIVVWDTVLGLGSTPNPGSQVTGIVWTIVGFYFGSKVASDIAARVMAGISARRG